MYGMPAARGSRETIRRRGAPPRARVEVELEFTLGAHHYRIVRALNQAELYQDGDPAPIANSLGAVTERVTRLLGMTRDEFFNTYFTGQKELAVMAAMSAAGAGPVPLPGARVRAAPHGAGPAQGEARRRCAPGSMPCAPASPIRPSSRPPRPGAATASTAAAARPSSARREAFGRAERRLADVRPRWEQLQQLRESRAGARGRAARGRT